MKTKTAVIFRKWANGDVIAVFPAEVADQCADHCMSYEHVGQHGACSVDIAQMTSPCNESDYQPLYKELTSIGYDLKIVSRFTKSHRAGRINRLNSI